MKMIKNIQNPRIEFSTVFNRQLKNSAREIKAAFKVTLPLFREDPNHPVLRNHALRENFEGYRSIDVTEDWRALFKEMYAGKQKVITFHRIATHKDLYE